MNGNPVDKLGWPLMALLAFLLLCQGTWLFNDAGKHKTNRWFWGIWGLISMPMPTILYLLLVRKVWKKFLVKK